MIAVRWVAILAGAGLPMSLGALVFGAMFVASETAAMGRDWPAPLLTWLTASSTLGFLGAWMGAGSASRLERESPIVEGVVLALLPGGLAAFGALAWGLASGESAAAFAHAGALFVPPLIAAAASAWLITRRA